MRQVVIIQKTLREYRKEFFSLLRSSLKKNDVELTLVYGKLKKGEASKKDQVDIEWGKYVPNKTFRIGKMELLWQPCLKDLKNKDLVIVEQANKLLLNYYLMLAKRAMGVKVGYWGHGRNLQDKVNSAVNKFKYLFIRQCNWWFAYTKGVKSFVVSKGYPENKVTVLQNAINTNVLREQYARISDAQSDQLKAELGIVSEHIGIYCGAMYTEKRIDFILESCYRIKKEIPDFHFLFIGSGLEACKVVQAAAENDWIHYVGPKFGEDRIKYFKLASIQLMPGAVGLGILDSFALQTPLITTTQNFHGPEIEYLENGKNGIITADDIHEYTAAIVKSFRDKSYQKMVEYCTICAEKYTLETMVENFKDGILKCLDQ
jgi:glycosyltransferase involved in cell wall biosynthesis